jgi:hypothetical protein
VISPVFYLGGGQDHGEVGPVHLEEDGVLLLDGVGQRLRVHQVVVLVVRELVLSKICTV